MKDDPNTYRWSPHPAAHYAGDHSRWLLKLSTAQWNLAWLALPEIGQPAPPGFSEALKRSMNCTASVKAAHQETVHLKMSQMLNGQAAGFVHLACAVTWRTPPPLMEAEADWKARWLRRAQQARTEHPAALNRTIDSDVSDVSAARRLLSSYGWCQTSG